MKEDERDQSASPKLQLYPDSARPGNATSSASTSESKMSESRDGEFSGTEPARKEVDSQNEDDDDSIEDPLLRVVDSGVEFVGTGIEKFAVFMRSGVESLRTKNMDELVEIGSQFAESSVKSIGTVSSTALESLKTEIGSVIGEQYGVPEDDEVLAAEVHSSFHSLFY